MGQYAVALFRYQTHSRKVVTLRTGVVLNAERYTDRGRVTRIGLTQNRSLCIGQRDTHVGQITISDVLSAVRPPVSAGDGGDSPLVKNRTQSDHGVFVVERWKEGMKGIGRLSAVVLI